MKTNKSFAQFFSNKIITEEMLELALYSINKRAKNCRDKKNEYYHKAKACGYKNDYNYKTVESYKEKEKDYYSQKDFLLKCLLDPVCIHSSIKTVSNRRRIYDYEDDFRSHYQSKKYIYSNSYFDNDTDEEITFIDIIEDEKQVENFLFYETENYSFHIPFFNIEVWEQEKYLAELQTIQIDNLVTKGKDIVELVSTQFCKKLLDLVKQQDYTFLQKVA